MATTVIDRERRAIDARERIFMTGVSVRGVGLVDARMLATIALSLALTCVKIPKIEG